jgi:protein SCO1/2
MINRLLAFAALFLAVSIPATFGSAAFAAPNDSPWGASYFPNVPLVTQDGKTVRFYDDLMKGRKVLINFIYALCDQACPLDTANMARVQKMLGPRVGSEVFMYSITLDPEHDTPQALKAYAEQYGAGPGWLFLTGKREDIDAVRALQARRARQEGAAREHGPCRGRRRR